MSCISVVLIRLVILIIGNHRNIKLVNEIRLQVLQLSVKYWGIENDCSVCCLMTSLKFGFLKKQDRNRPWIVDWWQATIGKNSVPNNRGIGSKAGESKRRSRWQRMRDVQFTDRKHDKDFPLHFFYHRAQRPLQK